MKKKTREDFTQKAKDILSVLEIRKDDPTNPFADVYDQQVIVLAFNLMELYNSALEDKDNV